MGCVHTWASCYDGILHNLSGGLDSSIVLSCLVSAPSRPELICLNYFGTGPNEDERCYARAMARRAGAELVEHQLDPRAVRLQKLLGLRRSPRPWFYMYELEHGSVRRRAGGAARGGRLFSGAGGDGVFFQARAELAVTDYLFDTGSVRGCCARQSMLRACPASRSGPCCGRPCVRGCLQSRMGSDRHGQAVAANDRQQRGRSAAAKRNKALAHPWLTPDGTRGVPPGILWHIMSVSLPPAYYSSFRRRSLPERTMPLLSQPLVELCLRIPTYVLIRSGRDRALARRAFKRDLPAEIVRRQAKGRADQHVRNILDANLTFVREMLLDGLLVRPGLVEPCGAGALSRRGIARPRTFNTARSCRSTSAPRLGCEPGLTTSSAAAG